MVNDLNEPLQQICLFLAHYFPLIGAVSSATLSAVISSAHRRAEGNLGRRTLGESAGSTFATSLCVAVFSMILTLLPLESDPRDIKPQTLVVLAITITVVVILLISVLNISRIGTPWKRRVAFGFVIFACVFFSFISIVTTKGIGATERNSSEQQTLNQDRTGVGDGN